MTPKLSPDLTPLLKACFEFTGEQEGNVLHPYLDGPGNVTIGRGHNLYSALYASNVLGLPLDIVQPQWDALKRQKPGLRADLYRGATSLRLTPEKSDEIFNSDLWCHIDACRQYVPGFDTLPQEVQVTCVDIDFNVKGGIRTFPAMLKAIEARDWDRVIKESDRPQLPARSEAVRKLLQPLLV
jgi:GH24 family phage-related lysozyme (muramidase)